ncbi:MAG: CRISPR-associated endoribonuclease Cas6 [Bacteroidota bacterium]|nr:CRISPR-associated endoribonuclease Cas6 [Bacteroidota bacterium]
MRAHIKFEGQKVTIPFDHQPMLVGAIHKWLGKNTEHGRLSLYSFSRLEGAKNQEDGLYFENGGRLFFSSHNSDLIKRLVSGMQSTPDIFDSLKVLEVVLQEDPDFSQQTIFHPASPIFIKRRIDRNIKHILYNDEDAGEYLEETIRNKMKEIGLEDDTLKIGFETTCHWAGTKKINYKGIHNKANWCPVNIKAKPETKRFIWNVGLGNSTGIGFGAIK